MASAAFLVDGTVTSETPAEDRDPESPGRLRTVASLAKAAARTGKDGGEAPPPPPPTPPPLRRSSSIFCASTLTTAEAISGVWEGIGALSRSKRMRIGFFRAAAAAGAAAAAAAKGLAVSVSSEVAEVVAEVGIAAADARATDRVRVCCFCCCRLLDSAAGDAPVLALETGRSACAGAIAIRARSEGAGQALELFSSFFLSEKWRGSRHFSSTTPTDCLLPPTQCPRSPLPRELRASQSAAPSDGPRSLLGPLERTS